MGKSQLITCKSCGNRFSGSFCSACGEKVITEKDRRLKYFLGDFVNALTFADSKFWGTLKIIVTSPGSLSKNFIEGRRKRFMKPIGIFFFANLIYFLFPLINTFNTDLTLQMEAQPYSGFATELVTRELEKRDISLEQYAASYNTKTTELSKLLLIAMAVMMALVFWVIHLGSEKRFFSDHLTISLELMAFVLLYCIQLIGALIWVVSAISNGLDFLFSNFYLTTMVLFCLTYFFVRTEITFYGFKGWRIGLNVLSCIAGTYLVISGYRALLFFVTFWSI